MVGRSGPRCTLQSLTLYSLPLVPPSLWHFHASLPLLWHFALTEWVDLPCVFAVVYQFRSWLNHLHRLIHQLWAVSPSLLSRPRFPSLMVTDPRFCPPTWSKVNVITLVLTPSRSLPERRTITWFLARVCTTTSDWFCCHLYWLVFSCVCSFVFSCRYPHQLDWSWWKCVCIDVLCLSRCFRMLDKKGAFWYRVVYQYMSRTEWKMQAVGCELATVSFILSPRPMHTSWGSKTGSSSCFGSIHYGDLAGLFRTLDFPLPPNWRFVHKPTRLVWEWEWRDTASQGKGKA